MKKFILLIVICLLSSCAITRNTMHYRFVDAVIFQTLDSNTALALDDYFDPIQIITNDEVYYDGRHIIGMFVLVDTYSYETVQGRINVVPVYVRLSEYNKYSKYGSRR